MPDTNKFKDITPAKHRCTWSGSCSSIAISNDGKTYRIRGTYVGIWVDDHEAIIDIPASFLENVLKEKQND